jgi:hypothetical protein
MCTVLVYDRVHPRWEQPLWRKYGLNRCLADSLYPSPNSFQNFFLGIGQFFAHVEDVIMVQLNVVNNALT